MEKSEYVDWVLSARVSLDFERFRRLIADNIELLSRCGDSMRSVREHFKCSTADGWEGSSKELEVLIDRLRIQERTITCEAYDDLNNLVVQNELTLERCPNIRTEIIGLLEARTMDYRQINGIILKLESFFGILDDAEALLDGHEISDSFSECKKTLYGTLSLNDIDEWLVDFEEGCIVEKKERSAIRLRIELLDTFRSFYMKNEQVLKKYASFVNLNMRSSRTCMDSEDAVPIAFELFDKICEMESLIEDKGVGPLSETILHRVEHLKEVESIHELSSLVAELILQLRLHEATDISIERMMDWLADNDTLLANYPGIRKNIHDMLTTRNPGIIDLEGKIERHKEELQHMTSAISGLPEDVTQFELKELIGFITQDMALLDIRESRIKLIELSEKEKRLQSNPTFMRSAVAIRIAHETNRRS